MYEPTPKEVIDDTQARKNWAIPAKQGLYLFISSLVVFWLVWYDIIEIKFIIIFTAYSILYYAWIAHSAIYDQVATLRYENAKLREQQRLASEHMTGLLNDILNTVKPKKPIE